MDTVYRELDDVKEEVEKLKAECRVKTELVESLKNAHNEEYLKFQEIVQKSEKQAHELHLKFEEICELRKVHEDLKSNLLEKEGHVMHLSSENKKIQANFTERLSKLEEVNRELVLALDEMTVKNSELEQNASDNNKEISGLRTLLSATEKKYLEAEEKTREAKMLRQKDDFIMKLEEENRNMHDKMKWKIEQFRHLEEAHEKLQGQFQSDKKQWEKEKSALLEEITSLQTSLDSQTRTLEAVQSRLEMCNHALAHQESKRKLLEAEISEFKSRFFDVFTQCEEEKSKIQSLTIQRNEEIAELRNSLGEKGTLAREMELKIVRLEQENQELGHSVKELREAQIQNVGANPLLSKLRNKLRRLEEAHKDCASTMKSRECQWGYRVEKMEADIRTYKSSLTSKEQEIKDLLTELESFHYATEEYSTELLIYKSELMEAYKKLFSAETDKAVQIKAREDMSLLSAVQLGEKDMLEEELELYTKMLEESSESQLVLKGQLLQMENTLKYERCVALEAQEKLELEIANKNNEITQLGCELEKWKSIAETLKASSEEIKGKCQKMESSLISQVESEQALKDENESLIRIAKEQDRKAEEIQKQIALLELYNSSKLKEVETFKQEKEKLELEIRVSLEAQGKLECEMTNKNNEITQLECELEKWKSTAETLKACSEEIQGKCQKMESSIISQVSLIRIAKEKERKAEELQKQIAMLEQYNTSKLMEAETFNQEKDSLLQNVEEKECCIKDLQNDIAMACLQQESLKKEAASATLALLDADKALKQEKENLLKLKEEKDLIIKNLQELAKSLAQDLMCALSCAFSEQVEKWVEVGVLTGALKDAQYLTKQEIEEKNLRIMKSELEVNNLLEKVAYKEESILHLKQESEQLQALLEKKKLETEDLTEKQRSMESLIGELEFEKGILLQDITKLSTEREGMLAHMEGMCERIGELSGGDLLLMKTLGDMLNTSVDGEDWSTDLVDFDKLHVSTVNSENGAFAATTKKHVANFDGRAPLREVNNL